MSNQSKIRRVILGFLSGLLSAPVGLAIAYLIGIVLTGFKTREFLPTLLAAATVLPLMLLFVLALPTMMISILTGVVIALTSALTGRSILIGAAVGLILGEITLTTLLPRLVPGDFTSIISNPLLSALYGLLVGVITGACFQLFIKWNSPSR